jgi:hypothetical protein
MTPRVISEGPSTEGSSDALEAVPNHTREGEV